MTPKRDNRSRTLRKSFFPCNRMKHAKTGLQFCRRHRGHKPPHIYS